MKSRITRKLNAAKVALTLAGIAAVAVPLAIDIANSPAARAQAKGRSSAASLPVFEAASIKRNRSGELRTSMLPYPSGRLTVENNSLKQLIRSAYELKDFQLAGGPKWLDVDRYDVEAKAEGAASRQQLMLMLQTLLEDRFKLAFHRETKQLPVYELVYAKPGSLGSGLHEAKPGDPRMYPVRGGPGQIDAGNATMQDLAFYLSGAMMTGTDRLVLDRTGLKGNFDFTLEWAPDPAQLKGLPLNPDALRRDGPSLFGALQGQLGLKLQSARGPVEVLVIDGAEQPSEN